MPIRIVGDYRAVYRELDRVESLPDERAFRLLDAVLETGFESAQARVHQLTGSLYGSGKKKTHHRKKSWRGDMDWGGRSTGVNNPVDYAIYEKARDGGHDWIAHIDFLDPLYRAALLKGLGR